MNTSGWKRHLARARKANALQHPVNLAACYRGMAYRQAAAHEPDTLVRARAVNYSLAHITPLVKKSELFTGTPESFMRRNLPAVVSRRTYRAAMAAHTARGSRDFIAGWSHTLPHYPRLLHLGIDGLLHRIRQAEQKFSSRQQRDTLQSFRIALQGLSVFIRNHARAAREQGVEPERVRALFRIARKAPRTLFEAMQLVWLVHLAWVSEGRGAMAFGRMDQYLLPYYRNDIKNGRLTRQQALDLFCHFWVRIEELHDITNVCIGGTTPRGADATNELSYLILEATRLVQSPHANISARLYERSPEQFHRACLKVIRTGVGFPAIFNEKVTLQGLDLLGIPAATARDYCMVGCIETMLPGLQPAWGDSRYNLLRCLQTTMEAFGPAGPASYAELMHAYSRRLRAEVTTHAAGISRQIREKPVSRFADPLLSVLTLDCIARARDINDGGARFPQFHGVAGMGVGTTADALAALKKLVFEEKRLTWTQVRTALHDNFAGHEPIRQLLLNKAPKYGNHDPYVDAIAARLVAVFSGACLQHRLPDGGRFMGLMAANVTNIPAGKEVGASADGRFAGEPLSDAGSPHFGRDLHGPTAFLGSVNAPDYTRAVGGNVINMKFDPEYFKNADGLDRLQAFTRYFVKSRIPQLQFNFTGNDELLAAQKNPDSYRNLVVRVSGFSAYFTSLDPEVQHDVIRRRAHG